MENRTDEIIVPDDESELAIEDSDVAVCNFATSEHSDSQSTDIIN